MLFRSIIAYGTYQECLEIKVRYMHHIQETRALIYRAMETQ